MIQKCIYYLSRPSIPKIHLLNRNKIDVNNDVCWNQKIFIFYGRQGVIQINPWNSEDMFTTEIRSTDKAIM